MLRQYQQTIGSRRYVAYTKQKLNTAITAVTSKELTQHEASKKFGIQRSTLKNKPKGSIPMSLEARLL